ncbi:MAG TPA: methyltransferase domain-containing protein [Gemmatimonadaceae bacterium]
MSAASHEISGEARVDRRAALSLVGYSFLILFIELAFIRYISAYVRVFGFYLNMVVIATFLGMGVGLIRSRDERRVRWIAPGAIVLLFAAVKLWSNFIVRTQKDPNEHIWAIYGEMHGTWGKVGILPTVLVLFTLAALVMLPLGAAMGQLFRRFRPLTAYSLDIVGSLSGIGLFALLSAMRTVPWVWFCIAFAVWALLSLGAGRYAVAMVGAGVAAVSLAAWTHGPMEHWSPYYRINLIPIRYATSLHVNGSMHQWILDASPEGARTDSVLAGVRAAYLAPYRYAPRLDTVLVVGAGTGNDLANLLELGAKYVDAVEIDPTIVDIGRERHPRHPYADPRVHVTVNDARAFLRRTDRHYDAIVFGTLDSQTLLSGMGSLRLDNYVYTRESFEAARARLHPDGVMITYHMSQYPYIAAKIYQTLESAFGRAPAVISYKPWYLFNYTFVVGPSFDAAAITADSSVAQLRMNVALPHDDWPYLYLRKHTVPTHYITVLLGILAIAWAFMRVGAPDTLKGRRDWPMFFLGAGFLLVETKSVAEMSLLFGATWWVNVLVFASILIVILIANVLTATGHTPPRAARFAGLFVSLALAYLVPVRSLLWLGTTGQWILGGLLVALPVLFAALIFAELFESRADGSRALAFNVFGAVVGGVLEYLSMVTGTKALYLIAAVVYAAAFLSLRRSEEADARSAPALRDAA